MKKHCGDCLVEEGELHKFGCDMERCPKCKGQLISCGCKVINWCEFPPEPFFDWCFSCRRCGKIMPETKMVSDKEWKYICGATYELNCVLCEKCMNFIKKKRKEQEEKRKCSSQ